MERGNLVVALNSRLQRLDGVLEPLQPDVQRAEVVERPLIRAIERDGALVGRDGGIRLAQRFERTALKPQRLTRSRIERDRPLDVNESAIGLATLQQDAAQIEPALHVR